MFPKGHRVTTSDFDLVMKQGHVFHAPHFTLRLIREKGLTKSLFSVVAPKSVAKLAVIRNRLKRQMREALKLSIKNISIPGYMALLFAKKGVRELSYEQMKAEIQEICHKAF